jgi:hypothetical protein
MHTAQWRLDQLFNRIEGKQSRRPPRMVRQDPHRPTQLLHLQPILLASCLRPLNERAACKSCDILYRMVVCCPGPCCAASQVIAPSFTHQLRHDCWPCCTAAQSIQWCGQLAHLVYRHCWPCCRAVQRHSALTHCALHRPSWHTRLRHDFWKSQAASIGKRTFTCNCIWRSFQALTPSSHLSRQMSSRRPNGAVHGVCTHVMRCSRQNLMICR